MAFSGGGELVLPHPEASMVRLQNGDPDLTSDDFTSVDAMKQIVRNNIDITNRHLQGTPFRINFRDELTTVTNNRDWRNAMLSNSEAVS